MQVWGHKRALISIQAGEQTVEVVLHGDTTLDSRKTDLASLRFGPAGAAPPSARLETSSSKADLILQFRRPEKGITVGNVNACLEGRLQDGVPFQGCDLLRKAGK